MPLSSSQSPLFEQAEQKFDLGRLRSDLESAGQIDPRAWDYLKGVLCGLDQEEIAKLCSVAKGTVKTALTRGARLQILGLFSDKSEVDWKRLPAWLIELGYGIGENYCVNWKQVCRAMLDRQKKLSTNEVIASEAMQFDLLDDKIFVSLALVERKEPDRLSQDIHPARSVERYEEKPPIEYEAFREQVLRQGESDRIAIVGEPGAGKTTLLQHIAFWILEKQLGLPIWVSLGDLIKSGELQRLKDYLTQVWLEDAIPNVTEDVKSDFLNQLDHQKVWLLLDGADEIVASSGIALQEIHKQLRSWLRQSSIVLTCRINVWDADINALRDFQTYRTKEFRYPTQVEQFIENGFRRSSRLGGERLKTELAKIEHVRLQQLVRNPLRLMVLCTTWHEQECLPATKAELYGRFVNEFYKWNKTKWKKKDLNYALFPNTKAKQEKLNQALGRLACRALDEAAAPFRLPHNLVFDELGDPEDDSSDFWLALNLGWLQITKNSDKPSEKVYTFFHPTFQEYFAALAIDDWDYFLTCEDTDQLIEDLVEADECYRAFESQWIEVILLWIGRPDLNKDVKQNFVDNLVSFEDLCIGCYDDRAFFLSARVISEFDECDLADEITDQLIGYAFGDCEDSEWIEAPDFIAETAKYFIPKTSQKKLFSVIERTYKLKPDAVQIEIAELLIDTYNINPLSTDILENLVVHSRDNQICLKASTKLSSGNIDNAIAIKALENLTNSCHDDSIQVEAATELLRNNTQNSIAIRTLIELASKKYDVLAIEGLSHAHGDTIAIEVLEQIIKELEPIAKGAEDEDEEPDCSSAYWTAEDSLYQISSQQVPSSQNINAIGLSVYEPDENYINDRILEDLEELEIYVSDILETNKGKTIEDENLFKELLEIYLENYTNDEDIVSTDEKTKTEIEISEVERSILRDLEELLGGKNPIIAKVLDIIYSIEDDQVFYDTLDELEKIGKDNITALNGVINLAVRGTYSHRLNMVIYAIAHIGGINNLVAIDFLTSVIATPQREEELKWIAECAVDSLKEILQDVDLMLAVVAFLEERITHVDSEANPEVYLNCYSVLWHCSQYLSYPDFFNAWHSSSYASAELSTDD